MHIFESEEERIKFELTAESGWLKTSLGHVFCWYHSPRIPSKKRAVLLCDTLGSERMNLHLTYRHLAIQLAYAGYPVLRLDYPGTCDSEGSPRDAHRMDAWLGALDEGAEFLKHRSGVSELTVFGALFGGNLAALVASRRHDVTSLAAWGAYATGGEYLRFLKAQERLIGGNPERRRAPDWQEGDLEAMGFLFTQETVQSLQAVAMEGLKLPAVRHACLLGWDENQVAAELKRPFQKAGAELQVVEGRGMIGSLSLDKQTVPTELIRDLLLWLGSLEVSTQKHVGANKREAAELFDSVIVGEGVAEETAFFGTKRQLFGIVSMPCRAVKSVSRADQRRPAIVLVNAGRNQRAGINRNYTEWARRWSQQGYIVLRMDIAGLGDSPAVQACDLNTLYLQSTSGDVSAAMDHLQGTYGVQKFILGGLCAGGFQCLSAARKDIRLVGLWLLELLRFYPVDKRVARYVSRVIHRFVRFCMPLRMVPIILDTPLSRWLRRLLKRGALVLVVYREDEPFYDVFRQEVSVLLAKERGEDGLQIKTLPHANHIFTPLWSQAALRSILDNWLSTEFGAKE